ncbi:MAG: bifunctional phosphoserine phosphatase/homoserine phosphotransferase ThrH [Spirochaetales bacterium]|nr:bifunctional phosphoserine phosphatase/homoserine phosphotransferase ThrH [Spirochaetales bacterium]
MRLVCLDLEGVLVPEIWQGVAADTGVAELNLTTRDIPDYHKLMRKRLTILRREGVTLPRVQAVAEAMRPLEGAKEFLDELRARVQVAILSDTYAEFASPLMQRLGWPLLLCNTLSVDGAGLITDYHLRQEEGKLHAVRAFRTLNLEVYAAGDSYNDLSMILAADKGAFFRPPESIVAEHPDVPVCRTYQELLTFLTS